MQGVFDDLLKDNYLPLGYQEFKQKYNIQRNFINFYGILDALNSIRPQYQQVYLHEKVEYPSIPISIEPLIKYKKGSKDMYNILIANETVPTGRQKWKTIFHLNDEE